MTDQMYPRFFVWDDDLMDEPVPFRVNSMGEWVVSGASLALMAEATLRGIREGFDKDTPAHALLTVREITANYQQDTDECVLPDWIGRYLVQVDKDGNETLSDDVGATFARWEQQGISDKS